MLVCRLGGVGGGGGICVLYGGGREHGMTWYDSSAICYSSNR